MRNAKTTVTSALGCLLVLASQFAPQHLPVIKQVEGLLLALGVISFGATGVMASDARPAPKRDK